MRLKKTWLTVFLLFTVIFTQAQINYSLNNSNSTVKIENLSDSEIETILNKAKKMGYSANEISKFAEIQGYTPSQVLILTRRIQEIRNKNFNSSDDQNVNQNSDLSVVSNSNFNSISELKQYKSNSLFGFDFFNNPNITFTPNLNLATPGNYQIGPRDILLVDIWGAAQNNYQLEVKNNGAINIDNIGPVYVSGLSLSQAKSKIISYLAKVYSGIKASKNSYNKVYADVSLVNVRAVQVNIIGEVNVPGTYTVSALSTILNALYLAGGPTENGSFRTIKLIRDGKEIANFDIYNYLINGFDNNNILLKDSDVIIVPPYLSKVNVKGFVKRPGTYEIKTEETFNDLITFFGGFKSNAFKERILINRVNNFEKEVKEIDLNNNLNVRLKDGDQIKIDQVSNRYENRIVLKGAVLRPGFYQLTTNLRLSELIKKAGGLLPEAFLSRGVIYRLNEDNTQKVISFSVTDIINKKDDIKLNREDKIEIFNKLKLKEPSNVSINGAVNNPISIPFVEKMRIEDLIALAGGYKEGADPNVIDVFRRDSDGNYKKISKTFKMSSSKNLDAKLNKDFYLKPFDKVSVRFIKGYSVLKNVTVEGEVKYPGAYALKNKNERISDLIKKVDGFTPFAYIKGATLIRQVANKKSQQAKVLSDFVKKDSLISSNSNMDNELKIGINLEKIINGGENSKYNLVLKEGDILRVPSKKETVEVRGAVFAPALIRFDKNKSFKSYIDGSGGFSEKAKKSKSYIIYASGDVKSTKRFLFFKIYPKLEPGALIIVPEKAIRENKLSIQEALGITTGITTLGILVRSLTK
jgi:protein involved in polysaccharide export with SLBB domain